MNIDDTVIIPCPEFGFALRLAKHCFKCEHYKGMNKAEVGGVPVDTDNIDDYQILCGRPITRRMTKVVV